MTRLDTSTSTTRKTAITCMTERPGPAVASCICSGRERVEKVLTFLIDEELIDELLINELIN